MRLNYSFFFVALTVLCLYAASTHANDDGTTLAGLFSQRQITPGSTEYQELLNQAIGKVMLGVHIQLRMNKQLYHRFDCKAFLFRIDESTSKISGVTILAPTEDVRNLNQQDINKRVARTKTLVGILLRQCKS